MFGEHTNPLNTESAKVLEFVKECRNLCLECDKITLQKMNEIEVLLS